MSRKARFILVAIVLLAFFGYRQYRDRAGDAPADNKAVASADAKRADAPPAKPRMLGSIAFQPCTLPSQMGAPGVEAQCGSLSVAENPAEPEARRIELNIAWLPADEDGDLPPEPVFLPAGEIGRASLRDKVCKNVLIPV